MFTGLVEATGTLRARAMRGPGARLVIATDLGPLALGESVAVNGACLTVQAIVGGGFEADCSGETLDKTTLGTVPVGGRVNLERAAQLGSRLGGHLVTGHVDAKVRLVERRPAGESSFLVFAFEPAFARYVAPKGSVTLDGVSLTVNGARADRFDVVVIPHTQQVTTLGALAPGDEVNFEIDLIARYVARMMEYGRGEATAGSDDAIVAKLKSSGYL